MRVEEILASAALRVPKWASPQGARPHAARALWICACVTQDDAPTWLIYDTDDGAVTWCRVEDGVEMADLVDARQTAGGHADPSEVLRWLQGATPDPWGRGGHGSGDESVVQELGSVIRRS
ncbi:MAG: hypothetical protein ACXVX9_10950 [Mycobacteriaceae bacterium]